LTVQPLQDFFEGTSATLLPSPLDFFVREWREVSRGSRFRRLGHGVKETQNPARVVAQFRWLAQAGEFRIQRGIDNYFGHISFSKTPKSLGIVPATFTECESRILTF